MKKIFLAITFLSVVFMATAQSEFSRAKFNRFVDQHEKVVLRLNAVPIPTSGQGLIISGTPSIVTDFITIAPQNGTIAATGSLTPGIQYTIELSHYTANATSVPLTNYCGVGGFVVAGGVGNANFKGLSSSVIMGGAVNISSYVTIGYGYDPINHRSTAVVGGKFDLSAIEQGFLGSIFWIKPQ